MNFHSREKQIFKSFDFSNIRKDPKWTEASRNEGMQPSTTNNDSRQILSYNVYNQADLDNSVINGRGFIYLGI